jgi:protein-S-isoprenylcysteine O-methyltransferase Ste14
MTSPPVAVLPLVSRVLVALGWAGFFAFFFVQKKPPGPERVEKTAPASRIGIALQMVAFALVWMIERPFPRAGAPLGAYEITLDVLAPIVSAASAWMGISAVRTLGRQWSYSARLVQDHRLVTEGPYRLVRHPIYTAMFGKLIATNFAFGHPLGLFAAGLVFVIGTLIRIRSEEQLLRGAFGSQFEEYARRVPAFIPLVRGVPARTP